MAEREGVARQNGLSKKGEEKHCTLSHKEFPLQNCWATLFYRKNKVKKDFSFRSLGGCACRVYHSSFSWAQSAFAWWWYQREEEGRIKQQGCSQHCLSFSFQAWASRSATASTFPSRRAPWTWWSRSRPSSTPRESSTHTRSSPTSDNQELIMPVWRMTVTKYKARKVPTPSGTHF